MFMHRLVQLSGGILWDEDNVLVQLSSMCDGISSLLDTGNVDATIRDSYCTLWCDVWVWFVFREKRVR